MRSRAGTRASLQGPAVGARRGALAPTVERDAEAHMVHVLGAHSILLVKGARPYEAFIECLPAARMGSEH